MLCCVGSAFRCRRSIHFEGLLYLNTEGNECTTRKCSLALIQCLPEFNDFVTRSRVMKSRCKVFVTICALHSLSQALLLSILTHLVSVQPCWSLDNEETLTEGRCTAVQQKKSGLTSIDFFYGVEYTRDHVSTEVIDSAPGVCDGRDD